MSGAKDPAPDNDTIVAVATPPGRGGVGIVRLSGPASRGIGKAILGACPAPRHAVLRRFRGAGGETLDEGIALFFSGPGSFTGEDVLELHAHGGPVVLDLLVARALELGARPARAGEFSLRAYLNDRLDLVQAEAVADLIDSGSAQAARAAARSLSGEFSALIHELQDALTELRMYVEAAIDFPEEEVDFLSDAALHARIDDVFARFEVLDEGARQGCLLREGMTVVLAGRPNAGKSSLLNQLAGYEAAIVTDVPGTTRDVLREAIQIDGMPLHVIDTAGLRAAADEVEKEGIRRARAAAAAADRVLLLLDASTSATEAFSDLRADLPAGVPVTVLNNKIDLVDQQPAVIAGDPPQINISALHGDGLSLLREHLKQIAGYSDGVAGAFGARRRHLQALAVARQHAEQGARQLREGGAGELLAEELRVAQQALGEITGEFTSDDLLGRIFAGFCIGK